MPITKYKGQHVDTVVISGYKSDADNETHDIYVCPAPGLITDVTFVSATAALGTANGIDLVNGGVNGTATTVVQASTNNLNGEEEFIGVASGVADGDVLRILADNYTAARDIGWAVTIQLFR